MLAICGKESLDFNALKKTTIYDIGFSVNHPTIVMFWRLLIEDFSDQNKKDFLKFLTGSDRAPIRGLGDIKMTITKHGDGALLPASHTCFNHLLLPEYKDYE